MAGAVHLTLDLHWGVGRYSKYHYRSWTQKSAQVNYAIFIIATATIDFSLAQVRLLIEGGRLLSGRYFTVLLTAIVTQMAGL